MPTFEFNELRGSVLDGGVETVFGVRRAYIVVPQRIDELQFWVDGKLILTDCEGHQLASVNAELTRAYTDTVPCMGNVWVYEFTEKFL